jgi:uncharacterized protein (UPF0332 family)
MPEIKLRRCLEEGTRGGERHKGIKRISFSEEKIRGHISKAKHNFQAMISFHRTGFSDWSASASFYCLYHCLLALIAKEGFESRNQSCTFALVEDMIKKGKVSLKKEELEEIYDKDIAEDLENSHRLTDIRENMQYSVKTMLEEQEFQDLKERTKILFDKLRIEVERGF